MSFKFSQKSAQLLKNLSQDELQNCFAQWNIHMKRCMGVEGERVYRWGKIKNCKIFEIKMLL